MWVDGRRALQLVGATCGAVCTAERYERAARPGRHRLAAAAYRARRRERIASWRAMAGLRDTTASTTLPT